MFKFSNLTENESSSFLCFATQTLTINYCDFVRKFHINPNFQHIISIPRLNCTNKGLF